jgi:hypothetical protein
MNVVPADVERLTQLLGELEDLNIAANIVEGKLQTETRLAGNKFVESIRHEIDRLGNNWANAFVGTHAAHLEYDEFIDVLEDAGASVGQFRIRPNGLSHPKDLSGNYAYAIKEFIDSGYMTQSNMPKALR